MGDRIKKEDLKKEVQKLVEEAQTKVKDHYESARRNIKQKKEKTDEYIRENPEKSVLAGVGVGFITGVIISWLFSRRK